MQGFDLIISKSSQRTHKEKKNMTTYLFCRNGYESSGIFGTSQNFNYLYLATTNDHHGLVWKQRFNLILIVCITVLPMLSKRTYSWPGRTVLKLVGSHLYGGHNMPPLD